MKKKHIALGAGVMLMALLFSKCTREEKALEPSLAGRESIFDRVVHLESSVITRIPPASRWCDRLALKKQRINAGDCELYVEEEGKGVPLVLINGGPGGTHHYFHPWFSRAKKWARVIYYDQRGTGLSDFTRGKDGYSVEQAVQDLDGIRRALGIKKWVVLGYSYGGFLAQYYATYYPEHLAGLILLGASPGMRVEMKPSRQSEFLSEEERARQKEVRDEIIKRAREERWPREKMTELFVYNNFINGDWKRQHYYKPSPERMSQIALYEWEHDAGFNDILGTSQSRVDLAGVFEKCPVPTLILEGRWDLTWNIDKPEILLQNHPGAKLVMFERSGHGIYDEEPDKFFKVVKEFIKSLPEASETKIALYKKEIEEWHQKIAAAPRSMFASLGWGRSSNEKIAAMYSQERFEEIRSALELSDFLKIGFALYDVARYEDALSVFEKMAGVFAAKGENEHLGLALIWQGHMLDLLGRRREAITAYKQVAEMNIKGAWRHDQFGLKYELSPYAKERMSVPFKRVENRSLD